MKRTAGYVVFDARGWSRFTAPPLLQRRSSGAWSTASIAIASNPDAAFACCASKRGVTVIARGRKGKPGAVAGQSAGSSAETAESLHLWEFARLGVREITAIGGGGRGWETKGLNCGGWRREGSRQLRPSRRRSNSKRRWISNIVELLNRCRCPGAMLNEVCGRLEARSLATNESACGSRWKMPEHEALLRLPVRCWMRSIPQMLQLELNGRPRRLRVEARLAAEPVKPRARSMDCSCRLPRAGEAGVDRARVRHLVGDGRWDAGACNTHRPDSFLMRAFAPRRGQVVDETPVVARLCCGRFRPPRYAQVIVVNRRPCA